MNDDGGNLAIQILLSDGNSGSPFLQATRAAVGRGVATGTVVCAGASATGCTHLKLVVQLGAEDNRSDLESSAFVVARSCDDC